MDSKVVRQKFLDYFKNNHHTIVSSSSLIPAEDPTLLFNNAGMNQFKDTFLGKEKRSYTRATSIQKCVRAGGKHNDLDQVGFTERHLTFFEMMGNFSFGDYFKKEAIQFAWNFLTAEMKLDADRLYASVYKDDDDAYNLWRDEIKLPIERIIRLGEADNFWSMGDVGPCGPCSEIYLDRGATIGCGKESCQPGCECARFIEIWNLVFMQYNRQVDGKLVPLEQAGVDTGMGFERLLMILQGKDNVFHIDSIQQLIAKTEELTNTSYDKSDDKQKAAYHVIADHIRSSALLIADGCSPANDGRGYVLRKIIRRGALFAQKISDNQKLFPLLGDTLISKMSDVYPELEKSRTLIISVLESEIKRFAQNLVNGQGILQKYLEQNKQRGSTVISGDQAFKLYDTYGFPPELTLLIGQEHGFTMDTSGFEQEMEKQKLQSGKKMKTPDQKEITVDGLATTFVGYEKLENTSSIQFVSKHVDGSYWISTEESPFYVESGGQVNDNGWVTINNQTFEVLDLKKSGKTFKPAILVKISDTSLDGTPATLFKVGDEAHSKVDETIRPHTVKNHTATHMLQAALMHVLGPQVKQAGSVVNHKYLRFDFTHHQAMTTDEIKQVEDLVNQKIQEDIKTNITHQTLKEAKEAGVISFFGEKYNPDDVRIVEIPGFSAELCGGTHAPSTGIIGAFKITSETALATGTRRIVAITGPEAIACFQQSFSTVKKLAERFKVKPDAVCHAVEKVQQNLQKASATIKKLKKQLFSAQLPAIAERIDKSLKIPFLYLELDDATTDDMKMIGADLNTRIPGFYFMVSKISAERFIFMGCLHKELTDKLDLKKFSAHLRNEHGLKGGGSNSFIQGGGTKIPESLGNIIKKLLN